MTTVSQCFQIGFSTSCSVSHFCEVRSIKVAVAPAAGSVLDTVHANDGSGAATYLSSAVLDARAVDGAGACRANGTDTESRHAMAHTPPRILMRREYMRPLRRYCFVCGSSAAGVAISRLLPDPSVISVR